MLAAKEIKSPVSGAAGAEKWNVTSTCDPDVEGRLVKEPQVGSEVEILPDLVRVQLPLRFELISPPLLLFLMANVTVKFDPVSALMLELVGAFRDTAIFKLSVNVDCASDWLPVAVR